LIKKRKYKMRIIIKITIGIRNNTSEMKTNAIKQLIIENKLIKAGFNSLKFSKSISDKSFVILFKTLPIGTLLKN
jgi:hypothetical protein